MHYFSYNDYMDYAENGEINEAKKVEEAIVEYELKNKEKMYNSKNKIIEMLKDKLYLKKFIKEFFNLSEIGGIENIVYYNSEQNDNITWKIDKKEIFILIRVIEDIDTNITYKMFETSLKLIKRWDKEEKREHKRYPIVIPIVIYIGNKKWKNNYSNTNSKINYIEYEENKINFSYNMIDINKLEIHRLRQTKSEIVKELINFKINIYK